MNGGGEREEKEEEEEEREEGRRRRDIHSHGWEERFMMKRKKEGVLGEILMEEWLEEVCVCVMCL